MDVRHRGGSPHPDGDAVPVPGERTARLLSLATGSPGQG